MPWGQNICLTDRLGSGWLLLVFKSFCDKSVIHSGGGFLQETLAAGKLTEPVLCMFLATGNAGVLERVKVLRIRPIMKPILPTCKFLLKFKTKLDK